MLADRLQVAHVLAYVVAQVAERRIVVHVALVHEVAPHGRGELGVVAEQALVQAEQHGAEDVVEVLVRVALVLLLHGHLELLGALLDVHPHVLDEPLAHTSARVAVRAQRHRHQPHVQEVDHAVAVHDVGRVQLGVELVEVHLILNAHIEAIGGEQERARLILERTLKAEALLEAIEKARLDNCRQVGSGGQHTRRLVVVVVAWAFSRRRLEAQCERWRLALLSTRPVQVEEASTADCCPA